MGSGENNLSDSRHLSSAQTFFMKFVFPVIWIGGFSFGTLSLFLVGAQFQNNRGQQPPPEMKWLFLVATAMGTAFIYWTCMRLKRVDMDAQNLYISNYLTDETVPLENVETVTENRWINIHPVTIRFREPTQFGERIVFMPKIRWAPSWYSHPVVQEILEAIKLAETGTQNDHT
jgi:hypothetical protein